VSQLLRVSGIAVPVLQGDASHRPVAIGEVERAEDGTKLVSRRTIKESFKIKVAHQSPTDGIAWKKLFMGEGQTWDFNVSLYGSQGLGPSASAGTPVVNATAKFGAGGCQLTATTGSISYAALPAGGAKWTVMLWRKVAAGGFDHYVVTSAGHKWINGARNDGVFTGWLTVTTATGTVKLDADGASTTNLDDLVIFPFDVPDAWPLNIFDYGNGTGGATPTPFSRLAKLDIDGDLVDPNTPSVAKTVCAGVGDVEVVSGTLNGVYHQAIRVLDVELEEG